MNRKWTIALLAAVIGAGIYSATVFATASSSVTTTKLAQSRFGDIDLKAHTNPADIWQSRIQTRGDSDVYVVDNQFAPGGNTGWHSHPGPSLIEVVKGTVTNYLGDDPSCTPHVYPAGTGFVDAGGKDVHILRNESTTEPAETIAVQLLPADAPRKTDAAAPGNCPFDH
jgi:quercetin dioxygenase-like cupin family protein